jgi:predicted RNA binding protein YcfA (HicA-like mRNA interferase family)
MGILSNISGKEAVKIFQKFGYNVDHQTGSHIILYHISKPTLSIPNHKELALGLIRGLIKKSGLTVEEFIKEK